LYRSDPLLRRAPGPRWQAPSARGIVIAMKPDPDFDAVVMEVVDNQLRDGDPPETRQTLDRLLAQGLPKPEARRLIACVLVAEMYAILAEGKPFNPVRYARALAKLPELPEDQ